MGHNGLLTASIDANYRYHYFGTKESKQGDRVRVYVLLEQFVCFDLTIDLGFMSDRTNTGWCTLGVLGHGASCTHVAP